MALIDCPECGREVSRNAASCPTCGYPVETGTPLTPQPTAAERPKTQWYKIAFSMLARVALGGMLAGIGGGEEESVAAVIGGVIIAGSAIPTWYRWQIDRLRSGPVGTALAKQIDDRISELERRHREQMGQLEHVHAGQIADLEERLDFAERLLTKGGEIGPR